MMVLRKFFRHIIPRKILLRARVPVLKIMKALILSTRVIVTMKMPCYGVLLCRTILAVILKIGPKIVWLVTARVIVMLKIHPKIP